MEQSQWFVSLLDFHVNQALQRVLYVRLTGHEQIALFDIEQVHAAFISRSVLIKLKQKDWGLSSITRYPIF